jgi:glycosyltransferase involved in cell wall biosynthesis
MGKKSKSNTKNTNVNPSLPTVSLCTPTFNRRPFYPFFIKCIEQQTYPKDKIEWVIIDDGTDLIEDLVKDIPYVKYFKYPSKMNLGKKRNIMHSKCTGDIIVYMDDDDYYPPERVSHAVEELIKSPDKMMAGSSEMHIYFRHINKLYQFGPYGPNHATAATFAFKKSLLNTCSYDESACVAEEKLFLKNYTIPMVQLNSLKTILVCSHIHNSFDKKTLLQHQPNQFIKDSRYTLDNFIPESISSELKNFYLNIDPYIEDYHLGDPKNKPDVINQIQKLKEEREKAAHQNMFQNQMNQMVQTYESRIQAYEIKIQQKDRLLDELFKQNKSLKEQLSSKQT